MRLHLKLVQSGRMRHLKLIFVIVLLFVVVKGEETEALLVAVELVRLNQS